MSCTTGTTSDLWLSRRQGQGVRSRSPSEGVQPPQAPESLMGVPSQFPGLPKTQSSVDNKTTHSRLSCFGKIFSPPEGSHGEWGAHTGQLRVLMIGYLALGLIQNLSIKGVSFLLSTELSCLSMPPRWTLATGLQGRPHPCHSHF